MFGPMFIIFGKIITKHVSSIDSGNVLVLTTLYALKVEAWLSNVVWNVILVVNDFWLHIIVFKLFMNICIYIYITWGH